MFDLICLWTGRGVWFLIVLYVIIKLNQIPFLNHLYQRPYQFIKGLLPWKWWSQQRVEESKTTIKTKQRFSSMKIKTYRCFGILIDNTPTKKWYQPKHHLFIIKRDS